MVDGERFVRVASEADLGAIAEIHLKAYSRDHFTSRLSRRALVDYYRYFLSDGAQTLLLEQRSGAEVSEMLGFAVFGRNIGLKIAQFKRRNQKDILQATVANPITAGRKILRLIWDRLTQRAGREPADFLLLSIAVAKPGMGAGSQLLDAFIDRARIDGADRVGLYVNVDNIPAINAYINKDFAFVEVRGRQFYMERNLQTPAKP